MSERIAAREEMVVWRRVGFKEQESAEELVLASKDEHWSWFEQKDRKRERERGKISFWPL